MKRGLPKPDRPSPLSDRQFAAIAKALSDPRKFSIMSRIAAASEALPCFVLRDAEAVSAPTISHHVKALEQAGLIEIVHDGKFALLSFRRDIFDAYLRQLAEALRSPA